MSTPSQPVERSSPLGVKSGEAPIDEMAGQYVTFYLGDECFAFPMRSVLEIIRVPETVRVPLTPPSLVGLANLRGSVLPVLDLRRTLGLHEGERTDASRAVIADCGKPVGLVVDRVARVLSVDPARILAASTVQSTMSSSLLTGLVKDIQGAALIQLLDVSRIVGREFPAAPGERAHTPNTMAGADAIPKRDTVEADDDTVQLVSFLVDGQEYAFEISDVDEIVRVPDKLNLAPIKSADSFDDPSMRGLAQALLELGPDSETLRSKFEAARSAAKSADCPPGRAGSDRCPQSRAPVRSTRAGAHQPARAPAPSREPATYVPFGRSGDE